MIYDREWESPTGRKEDWGHNRDIVLSFSGQDTLAIANSINSFSAQEHCGTVALHRHMRVTENHFQDPSTYDHLKIYFYFSSVFFRPF